MPNCATLEEVRTEIDRLDRQIVRLLAERGGYVHQAGRFKSSEQGVRAPDRVQRMLADRRAWAAADGLDPDFVEALFATVVAHFTARELAGWRRASTPAPPTDPTRPPG